MKEKPDHGLSMEPLPHSDRVRTLKVDDRIELRRRWFFGGTWMFIAAAVFWNGAMGALLWGTVFNGEPFPACASLHFAVGFGLGYYALALVLNETRVFIEDDFLRVITGPVFTHRPREFHAHDIARVAVQPSGSELVGRRLYDLMIVTRKGDRQKVLGNLENREDGEFMKYELEFILGMDHDEDVERKAKN